MRELADDFNRSLGNQRNSFLKVSMNYEAAPAPDALQEPSDMVIVEPPCHPWEPIKVDESWRDPLHCLVCGSPFSIG